MAKPLLSKSVLNKISRTLYGGGVSVVFYKLTPAGGEVAIVTLTSGFAFVREQRLARSAGGIGPGILLRLAADAGITRAQLNIGGAVDLTINGITTRYAIAELLPMQQVGAGYALRLIPQKGAAG